MKWETCKNCSKPKNDCCSRLQNEAEGTIEILKGLVACMNEHLNSKEELCSTCEGQLAAIYKSWEDEDIRKLHCSHYRNFDRCDSVEGKSGMGFCSPGKYPFCISLEAAKKSKKVNSSGTNTTKHEKDKFVKRLERVSHNFTSEELNQVINTGKSCKSHTSEELGEIVRDAWIEWAKNQPKPKASWLVPWDKLSQADKEADMLIGRRLLDHIRNCKSSDDGKGSEHGAQRDSVMAFTPTPCSSAHETLAPETPEDSIVERCSKCKAVILKDVMICCRCGQVQPIKGVTNKEGI